MYADITSKYHAKNQKSLNGGFFRFSKSLRAKSDNFFGAKLFYTAKKIVTMQSKSVLFDFVLQGLTGDHKLPGRRGHISAQARQCGGEDGFLVGVHGLL